MLQRVITVIVVAGVGLGAGIVRAQPRPDEQAFEATHAGKVVSNPV